MNGPFRVTDGFCVGDGTVAVVCGEGRLDDCVADGLDRDVAEALCGVLNSAEAGQSLSVTLANLAAGRAA